jgi:hypothetical protein
MSNIKQCDMYYMNKSIVDANRQQMFIFNSNDGFILQGKEQFQGLF